MNEPQDDYNKHPWKEAVLLFSTMLVTAIILLTFSIRLLNSTDIVQKSTREVPPRPVKKALPIPEVKTRPADAPTPDTEP